MLFCPISRYMLNWEIFLYSFHLREGLPPDIINLILQLTRDSLQSGLRQGAQPLLMGGIWLLASCHLTCRPPHRSGNLVVPIGSPRFSALDEMPDTRIQGTGAGKG